MTDTTNTPVQIPDAAVRAAEEAVYTRHEHGFLMKPLVEPIDMRKALTAALPHLLLGYEVKKLEWVKTHSCNGLLSAKTLLGTYFIGSNKAVRLGLKTLTRPFQLLEQAKAAAQDDFERRVRECLVDKPVDVAAVRYDLYYNGSGFPTPNIVKKPEGKYVLHSEAAAMVDALKAELTTLKQINANLMGDDEDKPRYTTKRLKLEIKKAVEAELAPIKAQVSIGVVHQGIFYSNGDLEEYPEYSTGTKIYAAPVDQTAEIERLKLDLQGHIEGTKKLTDEKIDAEFKAIDLEKDIERLREALTLIANETAGVDLHVAQDIAHSALSGKEP